MGEKNQKSSLPRRALYRAYRSTSFDELIGQEHVTELLKTAVKNGTFSHAYLFTGQRGTGKTSAARILACAINNLPYDSEKNHLDIIEIDAASNRRIDDIRDLREKIFIAPVSAKYKVYIIDEVHMLTGESFNALLKTIEEPPAHTIFILATTELHKVPATIISRTQRFHFRPVPIEKVVSHLSAIAKNEKIDINNDALGLIAEHGGGSFRDSISLLDQLGTLNMPITTDLVESILGRARTADIETIINLLRDKDRSSLHKHLTDMMSQGISPVTLSEQLISALLRSGNNHYHLIEKLMAIPKAHFPQLLLLSTLLGEAYDTESSNDTDSPPPNQKVPAKKQESKQEPQQESKQEPQQETASVNNDLKPENYSTEQPTDSKSASEFDWQKILLEAKQSNPALYGVLSLASAKFDNDKLHLAFQYALHRKKLEQAQYRTQLTRMVQKVYDGDVDIIIEGFDKSLNENDDEQLRAVSDLMGGGERVTV